jgi:hypothetical protein
MKFSQKRRLANHKPAILHMCVAQATTLAVEQARQETVTPSELG